MSSNIALHAGLTALKCRINLKREKDEFHRYLCGLYASIYSEKHEKG